MSLGQEIILYFMLCPLFMYLGLCLLDHILSNPYKKFVNKQRKISREMREKQEEIIFKKMLRGE